MICPCCQDTKVRVIDTERFDEFDLRLVYCDSCGLQSEQISRLNCIFVYDPAKRKKIRVTLEEYLRVWLPRQNGGSSAD